MDAYLQDEGIAEAVLQLDGAETSGAGHRIMLLFFEWE